jgi:hypothetical protein
MRWLLLALLLMAGYGVASAASRSVIVSFPGLRSIVCELDGSDVECFKSPCRAE